MNFFAYNYDGKPFKFLGTAHICALVAIVLLNLYLLRYRKTSERARRKVRITMAVILFLDEFAWHLWNIYYGTWNIQEHLPLHACSLP